MRTFWMSFVNPDLPKGQQNLVICIIDIDDLDAEAARVKLEKSQFKDTYHKKKAPWIMAATAKAHSMGCTPGGEVTSYDITDHENPVWVQRLPRNRLLTSAEADALNDQQVH